MNGVRPQSWPLALNSSGGAPTDTPAARKSCQHQASAPAMSRPMGRSWTTAISPDARASCSSSRHCSQAWKPDARRGYRRGSGRRRRRRGGGSPRATGASPCRVVRPARSRWRTRSGRRPARRGRQSNVVAVREAGVERLQRVLLDAEDRVAVDAWPGVQRAARRCPGGRGRRRAGRSSRGRPRCAGTAGYGSAGSTGNTGWARSAARASRRSAG